MGNRVLCCALSVLFVMIFNQRLVFSMQTQLMYVILPLSALSDQEQHMAS